MSIKMTLVTVPKLLKFMKPKSIKGLGVVNNQKIGYFKEFIIQVKNSIRGVIISYFKQYSKLGEFEQRCRTK